MSTIWFIAVLLIASFTVANCDTCEEKALKADKCAKSVLFIGEQVIIPHTSEEYNNYCERAKKSFKCIRDYRPCLSKFPRQVFNIFVDGIKKVMKMNCDKQTNKEEILGYLKCYKPESIVPMYKCLETGLTRMMHIANHTEDNFIISDTCCASNLLLDCVYSEMIKSCPKNGSAAAKFTEKMINIAVKDVIDLACTKYSTTKECNAKYTKRMEKLSKVGGRVDLGSTYIVKPLIKIAQRLTA